MDQFKELRYESLLDIWVNKLFLFQSGLEDEFIFITDTSEMVLLYSRHLKQEKLTLDTGKRVMVVDLGGKSF